MSGAKVMSLQIPLFDVPSDWRPPDLSGLPSWDKVKRLGLDTETKDPHLMTLGPGVRRSDSQVVGISFAIEDGPSYYLPIRHAGGDNLPEDQVLAYVRDNAQKFKGVLTGANLNYDLDWLAEEGVHFDCDQRDVQIAAPLINELHNSYSLQAIAEREGFAGKDEALLREAASVYRVDPKTELWKLPARFVGPYAEEDAALPLRVLRRLERQIEDRDLWDIFRLECDLQPVLLKMRRRGVRIDTQALDRIRAWTLEEERKGLAEIRRKCGVEIPVGAIWEKGHVVKALQAIGVKLPKTPSGEAKADKDVLGAIDNPVAELIVSVRQVNKLRTTYAASIEHHMVNGRIHSTFNQMRRTSERGETKGARFGRLSSEHPNMQQQPVRGLFAKMWRSIYVPDHDGQIWCSADYSQQEPRMLTHFAELCGLPKAREAAQRYREDPNTDNHQMMADLCGIERKPAKDIYLGICYGMGGAKLARDLGLPTDWKEFPDGRTVEIAGKDAQKLLNRFHDRAPFVKALSRRAEMEAKRKGYIITILGRHCHFPKDADGNYDWTHKALNRLIQGSAADQTKKAVVELDREGFLPPLQVHDEVCGPISSMEEGHAIKEIMETCVPLRVPSKVDLEVGPSWGEATRAPA